MWGHGALERHEELQCIHILKHYWLAEPGDSDTRGGSIRTSSAAFAFRESTSGENTNVPFHHLTTPPSKYVAETDCAPKKLVSSEGRSMKRLKEIKIADFFGVGSPLNPFRILSGRRGA